MKPSPPAPPRPDPAADASLQVNVAPGDAAFLEHTLPHQLRRWAGQVREVLCVVDLAGTAPSGELALRRLRRVLDACSRDHPHLRVLEVDRSRAAAAKVREHFGSVRVPDADFRGRPIYPYLFGIEAAVHRYVLHLDSDMLFGGGSPRWLAEGVALLRAEPDVLTCSPLPGPPHPEGRLPGQRPLRDAGAAGRFRFDTMSTRVFLVDRDAAAFRDGSLRFGVAPCRHVLPALLRGRRPFGTAERALGALMRRRQLVRIDFLGTGAGMWSLHPNLRSDRFFRLLPRLVEAVESGLVPAAQRGAYDLHPATLDWLDRCPPGRLAEA